MPRGLMAERIKADAGQARKLNKFHFLKLDNDHDPFNFLFTLMVMHTSHMLIVVDSEQAPSTLVSTAASTTTSITVTARASVHRRITK